MGFITQLSQCYPLATSGIVVQPFCGISKFGIGCDINLDVKPKILCSADKLPLRNECADLVLVDPPYEDKDWKRYGTPKIKFTRFVKEAVRICKKGGYVCMLHIFMPIRPKGVSTDRIVAINLGPNHRFRVFVVWRKDGLGGIFPQKQLTQFA